MADAVGPSSPDRGSDTTAAGSARVGKEEGGLRAKWPVESAVQRCRHAGADHSATGRGHRGTDTRGSIAGAMVGNDFPDRIVAKTAGLVSGMSSGESLRTVALDTSARLVLPNSSMSVIRTVSLLRVFTATTPIGILFGVVSSVFGRISGYDARWRGPVGLGIVVDQGDWITAGSGRTTSGSFPGADRGGNTKCTPDLLADRSHPTPGCIRQPVCATSFSK